MYSYKNNGICQQISSCLTVLVEYIIKNTKNDKIIKNERNEKSTIQVKDVQNSIKSTKDEHDYDEFEIL